MKVAEAFPFENPSLNAAVLFLARQVVQASGADFGFSTSDILALTGSSRSQTHAMLSRVHEAVVGVMQSPGRPSSTDCGDRGVSVTEAVADYLMTHPGVVTCTGSRRRYGDGFRRLVVGLSAPGGPAESLTVEQYARAARVPLGSLKDWLRTPTESETEGAEVTSATPESAQPPTSAPTSDEPAYTAHGDIGTIVSEWQNWNGDFCAFCDHLRSELRIRCGRTYVARLLQALGLRQPRRRKSGSAPWSRDSVLRLFPGAQWMGDGTVIPVEINGRRFVFNVQAVVDVASDAILGVDVSDVEDEEAVKAAYDAGLQTVDGEPPMGITLDGKPCNHTESLKQAIAPTTVIPATPGRGEAKAAVEQKFGLFAQTTPPPRIRGRTERELASSFLAYAFTLWAWTRNGKPRNRLAGKTPAAFYQGADPTPEQMAAAREWLDELRRRYLRFCRTRERRADPVRRQILSEALSRLGIPDPELKLEIAFATYSCEAILRGIAVFEAKWELGTVPPDANPGRYLGGVIRNTDIHLELERTAWNILKLRIRHNDLSLAPLQNDLDQIKKRSSSLELPVRLVERALDAQPSIDFRFYTLAARQALDEFPEHQARALYPHLLRSITTSFQTDHERRHELIAELSKALVRPAPASSAQTN